MHTAPALDENPRLSGDITCDVAIVGAGFTGLRAAHRLAENGSSVVVLDAGDVGYGASGRTGGQVNPILPFNGPKALRERLGPTYFERLSEVSIGSADSLFSFIEKYQIDCQARQNGWLRVDHCDKARSVSRENAEEWNRCGANFQFIEGDELFKLAGTPAYRSGVLTPRGGAVQPLSLVRGLARLSLGAGARIFGRTPVTLLQQKSKGWRLQTPSGSVTSEWVVLATNGYTDGLLRGLMTSLFPIVSIQIATPTLTEEQIGTILPGGQTISDTRRVIMYSRREPDDRIVFGGHGKMDRDGTLSGFEWLKKDAERVFPQLRGVEWEFSWGGRLALTDDRLPHLHEPAKGLLAGLGYNGRGVAMSNVMGTVLADRILGAPQESLPFPVSPIKKIPFRNIQLLGKGAAIRWLQFLDRLEVSSARDPQTRR